MYWDNIPLLIILVLSVIGNNHSVSIAAASLLLVKLLNLDNLFPFLETHALTAGITILTIAVLTPLATGRISLRDMLEALKTPTGIIAIVTGIFVAWLAGQGFFFIKDAPEVVTAIVVGTIVGVCFFKGLAVGPLIAGGIVYLVLSFGTLFKH